MVLSDWTWGERVFLCFVVCVLLPLAFNRNYDLYIYIFIYLLFHTNPKRLVSGWTCFEGGIMNSFCVSMTIPLSTAVLNLLSQTPFRALILFNSPCTIKVCFCNVTRFVCSHSFISPFWLNKKMKIEIRAYPKITSSKFWIISRYHFPCIGFQLILKIGHLWFFPSLCKLKNVNVAQNHSIFFFCKKRPKNYFFQYRSYGNYWARLLIRTREGKKNMYNDHRNIQRTIIHQSILTPLWANRQSEVGKNN